MVSYAQYIHTQNNDVGGLEQDYSISIANALKILQSRNKSPIFILFLIIYFNWTLHVSVHYTGKVFGHHLDLLGLDLSQRCFTGIEK